MVGFDLQSFFFWGRVRVRVRVSDRSTSFSAGIMGAEGDSSEPKVGGEGEEAVAVNVRCSSGSKFTVRTSLDSTIEAFKALLAQNCDVPADQQRLIYKGRILKDDQTLLSYGKGFLASRRTRCLGLFVGLLLNVDVLGFCLIS